MNDKKRYWLKFLVPLGLIAIGAVGFAALTSSKAPPKKRKPIVPVPVVRVMKIQTGPEPITIHAQGTVKPVREIQLVSQVGGRAIDISPALVDGGSFEKDDILLRIEPVDYQLALALAESQVQSSESQLKMAQEEAAGAKEEWLDARADDAIDVRQPPPLVAKEPQLKAARARLVADRANLEKALLNLERTVLKAPFSGRVSGKRVDIGQYVAPGQTLASLYSTEAVEIVLPMENENLFWFHVPGLTPGSDIGSPAMVRGEIAGYELTWPGSVVRSQGKLDERTRMINVVIRVEEPYASRPPLAVGLFVDVDIRGRILTNASVIPRSALHNEDLIWIVADDRLRYRRVKVARFVDDQAVIQEGLKNGDLVVVTLMDSATDGMEIRVIEENEGASS